MPIFECARCNEMTYSASAGVRATCPRCGGEQLRVLEGDFDAARRSQRSLGPGDHATLIYDDVATAAPFSAAYLADGVRADERVLAGLQDDLRQAVVDLIEPEVELAVEWKAPGEIYGAFDADRVTGNYESMIREEPRTMRILAGFDAESAAGVDPDELARYEEMAHALVTNTGATVVCVFDETTLPAEFIAVAVRRHGLRFENGAIRRNEQFEYQSA